MTAGKGIVHSEMPHGDGENVGLQLWINLKAKDKMIEPQYQELLSKDIPHVEKDGVHVAVIAGESMGINVSHSHCIAFFYSVQKLAESIYSNRAVTGFP